MENQKALSVLHKMSVLGSLGGTIFDYFIDIGAREICLYAKKKYHPVLAALYSQAFWVGIKIVGVYSDQSTDIEINQMERGEKRVNIRKISDASDEASQYPLIRIGMMNDSIAEIKFDRRLSYNN